MIDLFAGCGGLSLGFENAGFTPVFVNELHQDALETYLANRHHELGGLAFAENPALRLNDAQQLKGKRLEQLISDLKNIPELDFQIENTLSASGGGSSLDVIAGGPPCQGYSGIGIRRSYEVDREDIPSNHLYGRMALIIQKIRPKIFLFENVRGLLNAKWTKGGSKKIWPDVVKAFQSISGYEVRWSLVFAKDYGVPQNRPRVLLVGIRKDICDVAEQSGLVDPKRDPEDAVSCGFLPEGRPQEYPNLEDLLGDLLDPAVAKVLRDQTFPKGPFETVDYPKKPKKGTIQELLRSGPPWEPTQKVNLSEHQYSKHRREVVEKFDHMLANDGAIPAEFKTKKFAQRVLKRRWDDQGPNITATSLADDYVHYEQPRVLTVREWARLQLFPDWYQFCGKRTTGGIRRAGNPQLGIFDREVPKYTQIGNAVPVGLAEAVGKQFRLILEPSD
ncbi:DNA (cytosine-5-)-methyltransferase [Halomonas denitrificans]|nr:DNA cytosine methyltransferase [Halomonas denitrificans]